MADHAHGTSEKRAIIVAANLETRAITVLGYDPVVIVSEATDGTVGFAATERGVATGVTAEEINRITGLASIDFKTNDGVQISMVPVSEPKSCFSQSTCPPLAASR